MSYTNFVSLLVAAWFTFEIYLLWLNYKGRFRYKLMEGGAPQRWIQRKVGVMALPVTLLIAFGIVWIAPSVIAITFNLSYSIALSSVVSAMVRYRSLNCLFDKWSVEAFEKHCLKCKNKENCSMKYLKHRVRMAVEYSQTTRNENSSDGRNGKDMEM